MQIVKAKQQNICIFIEILYADKTASVEAFILTLAVLTYLSLSHISDIIFFI